MNVWIERGSERKMKENAHELSTMQSEVGHGNVPESERSFHICSGYENKLKRRSKCASPGQ